MYRPFCQESEDFVAVTFREFLRFDGDIRFRQKGGFRHYDRNE
jgi:hypothetical protein